MRKPIAFTAMILAIIAVQPASAADAANGAKLYKKCAMCHAIEANKKSLMGPNLFAVVGRKAGSTSYTYSAAMKASGITWTPANLDAYLTKPSSLVKGTKMVFAGLPNPQDRADLIDYLKAQK